MGDELEPGRLMVYEPRVDGVLRRGLFLGEFRMEPTPADLLTDPRVRALVEAARVALHCSVEDQGDHARMEAALAPCANDPAVQAALAPFEEVNRGH